jgi:hypothetical protein
LRTQQFEVKPIKGIDERWNSKPESCTIIRDMTWTSNESWQDAGGIRQIVPDTGGSNPFAGEGRISSLHWFSQHNGARQWLLWETGAGKLRHFYGTGPSSPWVDLTDVRGDSFDGSERSRTSLSVPWQKTQSVAWGGRLYMFNGYDEPIVFNGRYVDRAGFSSAPPAPVGSCLSAVKKTRSGGTYAENWTIGTTVEKPDVGLGRLSDATTSLLRCAYRYVVTYLNERGQESPPSVPSEIIIIQNGDSTSIGSGRGKCFIFLQVPVGDETVVARRIYRTRNLFNADGEPLDLGYGEQFYFLRELQDNVVETFEDGVPDSSLGALLDQLAYGPMPAQSKIAASFKNRLFLAGSTGNELRFSAPLRPEVFPVDNVINIGESDTSPITAMYPTRNALVVFKSRGIYLVRMNEQNTSFYSNTMTRDAGCIAPNTVRELPGIGVVFLANDGVYVISGLTESGSGAGGIARISQPISDTMKQMNRSSAIGACGEVYHKDREYWLCIPTLGSSDNDLTLIFHYEIGEWSIRENIPANCLVESHDHRGYLFIGSNDQNNKPGVLVYSRGWENKLDGDAIEPYIETNSFEIDSAYTAMFPKYFFVQAAGVGNNDLELNYRPNMAISEIRASADTRDQQDIMDRMDVYGTAEWGTSTWGKIRPVPIRYDVGAYDTAGPIRSISFTLAPSDRRIEVIGFSLGVAGHDRQTKGPSDNLSPDRG